GSNYAVTKEYVDSVLDQQQGAPYVILQNEISEVPYIIEAAYKKGFPVVFNASPFDASLLKIDFSKITWLLVNEIEGGCVTGETEPEAILKKMREKYPETGVVLTLGKEGSICAKGDTVIHQGIFPVNTVDTTAAGDTFTGYFIAGLDAGLTLEEALCRASAASAVAVTRPGAAPSIPLAEEVTAFLKERQ
ncbi:MAG: ribokinase, partial [Oscillospiraceae bacterium]|nr:ribokinase [Oscillospiraceae bacterium]